MRNTSADTLHAPWHGRRRQNVCDSRVFGSYHPSFVFLVLNSVYIVRAHQPLPTPSPSSSMHQPLPAHQTKHLPTLTYPFNGCTFLLAQSSDGTSNGTALWLGAQLLSVYAASALDARRPKAVELGSGVGLTACVLHRPRPV